MDFGSIQQTSDSAMTPSHDLFSLAPPGGLWSLAEELNDRVCHRSARDPVRILSIILTDANLDLAGTPCQLPAVIWFAVPLPPNLVV